MRNFKIKTSKVNKLLNSKSKKVENVNTTVDLDKDKTSNCIRFTSLESQVEKYNCSKTFSNLKTINEKIKFIDNFYHLVKINNYFVDFSPLLGCRACLCLILEECLENGDKTLITNINLVFYSMFSVKRFDKEISEMKLKYITITKKYNNTELLEEFNSVFCKRS